MKVIASLAALLLAGPALAQTASPAQTPAQTAPASSSVTRDLNSGPPAPATYLAPAPAVTTTPAPAATITPARTSPSPAPTTHAPATVVRPSLPTAPAPTATQPRSTAPTPTPTPAPAATQPRATPPATTAPVRPTPAAVVPAPAATAATAATAAATPAPAAEPAPPPPPAYTVLDAPARAALPFSLNLPAGFQIDAERSGPDFKMYAVRRNGTAFVMIYAGPSSEFPIYSGQVVEAAGRSSVVATEDGQRHAKEHLFQRETAPREVHIWVSSLDGADRALAEAIAQSVDVR